jgi:hypothetical protein
MTKINEVIKSWTSPFEHLKTKKKMAYVSEIWDWAWIYFSIESLICVSGGEVLDLRPDSQPDYS